jgi:hypothetical protein
MNRLARILTAMTLTGTLLAATGEVWAQARANPPARSMIDVAKQLKLKLKLAEVASGESLSMSINRQEWDRLTPDERDKYRREALAFLGKSPEEQEKVLKHYDELVKLSDAKKQAYLQRAAWLHAVVESFTAQERKDLTQLPPDQRAKRLLQRKAELIQQGKLAPDTQPATAPAE